MPSAVFAIATAFSAAFTTSAIISAVVRIGIGLALSALLTPKHQGNRAARRQGGTFAVRQPAVARRILYGEFPAVGGIWTYVERTGTDGKDLFMVLYIGDGPINEISKVYFDGDEVALASSGNDSNGRTIWKPIGGHDLEDFVRISLYTGAAGQPADASLVAASASKWTAAHTGDGVAYAVVKLTYDQDAFPQGIPNISFSGKGRDDVYDPRTGTTLYTRNCALCLNHYLTKAQTGLNATYATEVNETALIIAANVCAEQVATAGGYGDVNRYNCDGFVNLSDNPETIIDDFKEAMAGWMTYVGGRFVIHAGAYNVPTFDINEDMIIEAVTLTNRLPRRERINRVRGVYVSEENKYQETDFPAMTNSSYEVNDGEELAADLNLVFTSNPESAQRLAKIILEKARKEKRVTLRCNMRALRAEAGKTVTLTFGRYGYNQKVFFVESSTLAPIEGGKALGVDLELREYNSDIYDWNHLTDPKTVSSAPALIVSAPQVADVIASPVGGSSPIGEFPIEVTLSCATDNAIIRWSRTESPTDKSAGTLYDANDPSTHPVVRDGETLYARAFLSGIDPSDSMSETYSADSNPVDDVSNLYMWWRADVAGKVVEYVPGSVSPWWSLPVNGGTSLNAQVPPNNRGRGINKGVSTMPSVDREESSVNFDGTNDRLRHDDAATDRTLPKTIIVCATTPASPSGMAVSIGNASSADQIGVFCDAGTWKARSEDGGSNEDSGGIAATANGTDVVAAVFTSTTSRRCRVNKVWDTENTNSSSPVMDIGPTIGAEYVGGWGEHANIDIHEILIYNRALSAAEIDTITDYLTDKYPVILVV